MTNIREEHLVRALIDILVDLKLLDVGYEDKLNPLGSVYSGERTMMVYKIHGVLHNVIKQRKCTR